MRRSHAHLRWKTGNDISLLENGVQLFPALCCAFDAARSIIQVEMYIFRLDSAGQQLLHHLINAAQRGVKVRVLIDGYGSAAQDELIAESLHAAGAQCRIYRPEPKRVSIQTFDFMRLRRLHRKIVVIDSMIGFVGGINFEDDYSTSDPHVRTTDPRFDYAVRVTGPIVSHLTDTLNLLWQKTRGGSGADNTMPALRGARRNARSWRHFQFKHLRKKFNYFKKYHGLRRPSEALGSAQIEMPTRMSSPPNMRAAVVLRDNLRYRRTIERAYLSHIAMAEKEIIIANAYFLPGSRLRRALIDAAQRGVRIRLLLQGKIEYRMQYHATRWIYDLFLREGIEIYEYLPSFFHAKVAIIDDISIVGSSNLDPFSLLLAREANILISDVGFTATLHQSLEAAMTQGSQIVELSLYSRRPWLSRLSDGVCYLLLRIGVSLTGKGGHY